MNLKVDAPQELRFASSRRQGWEISSRSCRPLHDIPKSLSFLLDAMGEPGGFFRGMNIDPVSWLWRIS